MPPPSPYIAGTAGEQAVGMAAPYMLSHADHQLLQPQIKMETADTNRPLSIRVIGIPATGAKSRVETHIKLTIQLVDGRGQKVRGYEYLRLPEYALISNRPRLLGSRNGTTAPPAEANVLSLQAEVVCASAPGFPISVCNNCVTREQKRARYRRERGGADDTSPPEQDNSPPTQQVPALSDAALARAAADTQRILLFNCSTLVEFSSGDAILPTRITCYCRHHNEKIGFCVNFVLRNHLQQVVAVGRSPPIMIMDDHKSARSRTKVPSQESPMARTPAMPVPRPLLSAPVSAGPVQPLQLQHHLLQHQQHAVYYSDPEATPSPMQAMDDDSVDADTEADAAAAAAYHAASASPAFYGSPSSESASPPFMLDYEPMFKVEPLSPQQIFDSASNEAGSPAAATTAAAAGVGPSRSVTSVVGAPSKRGDPYPKVAPRRLQRRRSKAEPAPSAAAASPELAPSAGTALVPSVSRVVPGEGPLSGGIEVTILGSDFSDDLSVFFGDHEAPTTQCWSTSTLICTLPPAVTPGPVVVSVRSVYGPVAAAVNVAQLWPRETGATLSDARPPASVPAPASGPILFVYKDDTEQSLMALALRIVGMRMSGRVDDLKNIALAIVQMGDGRADAVSPSLSFEDPDAYFGEGSGSESVAAPLTQQHAALWPPRRDCPRDQRERLRLERTVVRALQRVWAMPDGFYTDLDATTAAGETMLHLAARADMPLLAQLLLDLGADYRVHNGCGMTALHVAAWLGHAQIVALLLNQGAFKAEQSAYGLNAAELATSPAVLSLLGVPPIEVAAPERIVVEASNSVGADDAPNDSDPEPAAAAAASDTAAAAAPVVPQMMPSLPGWNWFEAAMKAGGRLVDMGREMGTPKPHEVRVEKQRRRKRDRMLYNFWIPLVLVIAALALFQLVSVDQFTNVVYSRFVEVGV